MQDIVDKLMVKGTIEGTGVFGLFKTNKRLFEVLPGETLELDIDDVPEIERAKIEDALESRGKVVNEENILDLYRRKIGG